LSYDNYKYSYVDTALAAGYSTLAIDRLGIGNSSHGDPFNEIQAQAEVEALNAVTTKLRNGGISEVGHAYKKVVHVGHSFGSVQSYWLSSKYPNNTDGVILTGFSGVSQFLPVLVAGWDLHSARLNQPLRFGNAANSGVGALAQGLGIKSDLVSTLTSLLPKSGISTLSSQDVYNIVATTEINDIINGYNYTVPRYNYPSGYLAQSDLTALQFAFLYPGMYDVGFAIAGEKTKQPVTVGELLTIGSSPASSSFAGPVLVLTGEHDLPFCGGNCYGKLPGSTDATLLAGFAAAYPASKAFETYVQPTTGHGLNFHYNATAGYKVIQNFLAGHGLGA
jgi:pimeloyl-ACP methyl ester carboxylesterase